jgi:hypothetical protein
MHLGPVGDLKKALMSQGHAMDSPPTRTRKGSAIMAACDPLGSPALVRPAPFPTFEDTLTSQSSSLAHQELCRSFLSLMTQNSAAASAVMGILFDSLDPTSRPAQDKGGAAPQFATVCACASAQ